MMYRLLTLLLFCAIPLSSWADQINKKPRLVVTITVGSMRSGDIERYADRLGDGGFKRLLSQGVSYEEGRYNFQNTKAASTLTTLATGAEPSVHGVVGAHWYDYIDNSKIELVRDAKHQRLGAPGDGFSPNQLIAPTLGDALKQEFPKSKIISISAEPQSAILMSGRSGDALWIDSLRCNWASSTYYYDHLPQWIDEINRGQHNLEYVTEYDWGYWYEHSQYVNSRQMGDGGRRGEAQSALNEKSLGATATAYEKMIYSPAGNSLVLNMAKNMVVQMGLGADSNPDLLNITLDSSNRIAELFGPESIEAEDAFYMLDYDLADFLTFLYAQVDQKDVVVVLTAAHGTSPSFDAGQVQQDRFNSAQFEVIINGFLNARYGAGDWVLGFHDKSLYLNHNLIYERKLDLAEIQNEVVTFAMQFRGVSHALSSTAMRTSYFGDGYGEKIQNSFYPRHSGDVIVNLMPGWIEFVPRTRSSSGSMYGYDTDVPLIFSGFGLPTEHVARTVSMTSIAPTLAKLMGISEPAASSDPVLESIVSVKYK